MHQKAGRLNNNKRRSFKTKSSYSNNKPSYNKSRREHDEDPELVVGGRAYQKAVQTRDKYLEMAREMLVSGDRVAAENYFQHADHYVRVINAAYEASQERKARMRKYYEEMAENGEAIPEGEGEVHGETIPSEEEPHEIENEELVEEAVFS